MVEEEGFVSLGGVGVCRVARVKVGEGSGVMWERKGARQGAAGVVVMGEDILVVVDVRVWC